MRANGSIKVRSAEQSWFLLFIFFFLRFPWGRRDFEDTMPRLSRRALLRIMSLIAQTVFKLHEKFMSFIKATSTYYHHILPRLGNRSLLKIGKDGKGETSVKKKIQHMASPYHFWVHLLHKWQFFQHLAEGEQHKKAQSMLTASSSRSLNHFLELMRKNNLSIYYT